MVRMSERKASDVFVECLEAEGVRYVFGIPGEETLDLSESLANSLIVFDDADLDAAAAKAAGQYDDAGQVCLAGTRLLVQESIREAFLERFHAAVDAQVLGDPRRDETTIAPLIHPDHLERVDGFVQRAIAEGHHLIRGGHRLEGLFYEPTLFEPLSNEAEIVQREVFG